MNHQLLEKLLQISPPFPKTLIAVFCLLLLGACQFVGEKQAIPKAENGILDLSNWDFTKNGSLKLEGDWAFFSNQLLAEIDLTSTTKNYIAVPDSQSEINSEAVFPKGQGCATYHLFVDGLPTSSMGLSIKYVNSAYRLIVNGVVVQENGQVSCRGEDAVPDYTSRLYFFDNQHEQLEIILQVSNFHTKSIGIPTAITLGLSQEVAASAGRQVGFDTFLFGALIIIVLYHFILFLLRRKERSLLYFTLAALAIGIRTLVTGEQLLYSLMSPDYWSVLFGLDYVTYTSSTLFFMLYMHSIFPKEFPRWQVWSIAIPAGIYTLIILFTPSTTFVQFLSFFQIVTGIGLLYLVVGLVLAIARGRENAKLFTTGFLTLAFGITNDLLYYNSIYISGMDNMTGVGVFIFFIIQSILLGTRFSRAFNRVKDLSEDLQKSVDNQVQLNQAIKRFVPVQFLQELGKEGYSDIRLGDSTAKIMTVLFSDLRSFTKFSESLSPKQNFKFLNSYLKRMEPYIQEHNGFVDKYIGDAIMALFRDGEEEKSAEAALRTALALRIARKEFNIHRSKSNYQSIDFGVGINTGALMLGTVGSENRIDTTVIGDTVNLASRLEALTKYFGTPILISDFTYQALTNPDDFPLRKIDRVRVPGKENPVVIYELISSEEPEVLDRKMGSLINFYNAMDLYTNRQFEEALETFSQICEFNPKDSVAAIYKERCSGYVAHPPSKEWNGVMEVRYK